MTPPNHVVASPHIKDPDVIAVAIVNAAYLFLIEEHDLRHRACLHVFYHVSRCQGIDDICCGQQHCRLIHHFLDVVWMLLALALGPLVLLGPMAIDGTIMIAPLLAWCVDTS